MADNNNIPSPSTSSGSAPRRRFGIVEASLLMNQLLEDEEDVLDANEAAKGLSDDDDDPDYQPDNDDYDQQSADTQTPRRSTATRSTNDSARSNSSPLPHPHQLV